MAIVESCIELSGDPEFTRTQLEAALLNECDDSVYFDSVDAYPTQAEKAKHDLRYSQGQTPKLSKKKSTPVLDKGSFMKHGRIQADKTKERASYNYRRGKEILKRAMPHRDYNAAQRRSQDKVNAKACALSATRL